MANYIKHNSNYIKTKTHQFLKGGSTIFERDWVTLGNHLSFGPGKIPYYTDGNFIFTTTPSQFYQKKYKRGVTEGVWTYDDVKDATGKVNQIKFNEYTEDIRSYAYYGSCSELIRASIEHIINTFPGRITVSNTDLGYYKDVKNDQGEFEKVYVPITGTNNPEYKLLDNPFDINLFMTDVVVTHLDNPLHYFTHSYDKYEIKIGDNSYNIDRVDVTLRSLYQSTKTCIPNNQQQSQDNNIPIGGVNSGINTGAEREPNDNNIGQIGDGNLPTIGVVDREEPTTYNYTIFKMLSNEELKGESDNGWVLSTCKLNDWLPTNGFYDECQSEYVCYSGEVNCVNKPIYEVTIKCNNGNNENKEIVIKGYKYNGEILPFIDSTTVDFIIQPKQEVIDEYFNNLKGFEKQLLTRESKPLYSNKFITPLEYNFDYVYYKRAYTWPSNDYCIDINSPSYFDFISRLNKMAQIYDELWSDNIWNRMTHEAIKNYDWTYTREFEEGDEIDNVDGGERMHKVINIIGRVFDDIKTKIDTIKRTNKTTYDDDRNIPNALLSDKLELKGWDIYSVIPNYEADNNGEKLSLSAATLNLDDNFFTKINEKKGDTYPNLVRWYQSKNYNEVTFADVDNEFMRRMLLSSRRIFETKGTRQSIDMIMGMFGYGENDYEIIEEYREAQPVDYDKPNDVDEEFFGDKIVRLNNEKENDKLYDEDTSGIPVGSFLMTNVKENAETKKFDISYNTYLIPFYNQRKEYDGNLYFQLNGGWGYNGENDENPLNPYNWSETVSYLHVVPNVGALMEVNSMISEEGDIYYVSNISDYMDYSESPSTLNSNFFVLENKYMPENFDSWKNIDFDDETESMKPYIEKAKYLDSIIPYNLGNNPHVGYGNYDGGKEFFEYMRLPFKYAIENYFFESGNEEEAKNIKFYVSDAYRTGYGKLLNNKDEQQDNSYLLTFYKKNDTNDLITKEEYDALEDSEKDNKYTPIMYEILTESEYNNLDDKEGYEKLDKIIIFADEKKEGTVDIVSKERTDLNDEEETPNPSTSGNAQQGGDTTNTSQYTDGEDGNAAQDNPNPWGIMRYANYKLGSIDELAKKKYYLNSKVIHLRNYIDNNEYRIYFKNVIVKYLLQVIPSTAILLLEGFEITDGEDTNKHRVHFLDADERTQLYPDEIVNDGGTATKPNDGLDWYNIYEQQNNTNV